MRSFRKQDEQERVRKLRETHEMTVGQGDGTGGGSRGRSPHKKQWGQA